MDIFNYKLFLAYPVEILLNIDCVFNRIQVITELNIPLFNIILLLHLLLLNLRYVNFCKVVDFLH